MIIYQDLNFKELNSLKINTKIKLFLEVSNVYEIYLLQYIFKTLEIKFFVIGNATKVLFASKIVKEPVIYINKLFSECYQLTDRYLVSSGTLIANFVMLLANFNLGGFESLSALKASIGGLTYMNASDHLVTFSDYIEKVIVLDENNQIKILNHNECEFNYRSSIFQKKSWIILYVLIKPIITIKKQILNNIKESLKYRLKNQDYLAFTCGSLFKNINNYQAYKLIQDSKANKITVHDAKLSTIHANFLINAKNANAQDIFKLIKKIQKRVYKKYQIKLVTELNILY